MTYEPTLRHDRLKQINHITSALYNGTPITNGNDMVRYDGINMRIKVEGEWWETDFKLNDLLNRPHKWEVVE